MDHLARSAQPLLSSVLSSQWPLSQEDLDRREVVVSPNPASRLVLAFNLPSCVL